MNENYIVINGKRLELTKEQLKALGIEPEKKRKNPFERVKGKEYYCIGNEEICMYCDYSNGNDKSLYKRANYFNDESFAKQVALHHLLYRKLLKFAYENGCEDREWGTKHEHWCIYYDTDSDKFDIDVNDAFKYQGVYFSTREGAERTINEVVEPFMKEHPEFVW